LFKARINIEIFPIFEELFRLCAETSPCVEVDMKTKEEAKKSKMFEPYCSRSLVTLLKRSTKIRNKLVHGRHVQDRDFLYLEFRDNAYELLSRLLGRGPIAVR